MEIRGKRVIIAPMELRDVYSMKDWGKHDNPLFFDYNLPMLSRMEMEEWYSYKTGKGGNKYYSIFNKDCRLIGYIGIKRIRRLWKDSVLGIVFDPLYMNQGYGTEAITTYLEYYFKNMKMRAMFLEVAKFNRRAISCYRKCGFYIVDKYLNLFFDQQIDRSNRYFVEESPSFEIIGGRIYNYIYRMKVDGKAYKA